jgi:hypothetical protein
VMKATLKRRSQQSVCNCRLINRTVDISSHQVVADFFA